MTPRTTPFHDLVAPFNQTGIWKHWSGYLVAPQYQYSLTTEYYAIRNAVSLLDTSPLFKYRFTGAGARTLLERALARDIGGCGIGRAQYTCWCDDGGYVVQDGMIMQVAEGEYLLTAAEPALRWFRQIARGAATTATGGAGSTEKSEASAIGKRHSGGTGAAAVGGGRGRIADVTIDDISTDFGILALQGPHAHNVICQLTEDATPLRYFGVTQTTIAGCDVTVSRTGYTGDLGYEIWVRRGDAAPVWNALMAAGKGYNLTPIGTTAMKMARVEAGLLLLGTDFHSSRFAWVDAERETPHELGWGWMFRKLDHDDRHFIGREAIEREIAFGTSRWTTVGVAVDWHDYERVYTEAGILPPRHELYAESTMNIYRRGKKEWDYAGYASSFLTSSLLRQPLAIAKLPRDLAAPGSEVDLEVQVIRQPKNVVARVEALPFFNPPRRTAPIVEPWDGVTELIGKGDAQ